MQWRFIGRTGFDNNSSQPSLHNQEDDGFNSALTHIPNYSYLDMAANWNVSHVQLRAGVNNLFDKDPPFIPGVDVSANSGPLNTFTTYDIVGREIYVALRATF